MLFFKVGTTTTTTTVAPVETTTITTTATETAAEATTAAASTTAAATTTNHFIDNVESGVGEACGWDKKWNSDNGNTFCYKQVFFIHSLLLWCLVFYLYSLRIAKKSTHFNGAVKACDKDPSDDIEINACPHQLVTLDRLQLVLDTIDDINKAFETQYVRINAIYQGTLCVSYLEDL